MTLDEARWLAAQTEAPAQRVAAEQLLNEAVALPALPPAQRETVIARIRHLEPLVPDYHLHSFGASVLESVGDGLTDPADRKVLYTEAVYLARWYASGASSGGEGTARSLHVRELETKLQALERSPLPEDAGATAPVPAAGPSLPNPFHAAPPPPLPSRQPRRPAFLTALAWIFIAVGAIGIPMSFISSLMLLAGGDGTANASFLGGLLVLGGPPATLVAGLGLLRRWRWAYGYTLVLLALLAAYNLVQLLRGPTPERSTATADGVIHTVLASSANYPLHFLVLAISGAMLVKLLTPATRAGFFRRLGT